jgi:hypothetical protein
MVLVRPRQQMLPVRQAILKLKDRMVLLGIIQYLMILVEWEVLCLAPLAADLLHLPTTAPVVVGREAWVTLTEDKSSAILKIYSKRNFSK